MKQCSKCAEVKPEADFYRSTTSSDGRRAQCIECMRQRHRDNAAAINERRRETYLDPARRAAIQSQGRAHYLQNSAHIQQRVREYRKSNINTVRARNEAWRQANPNKVRQYTLITNHRQRAKRARVEGGWTHDEWVALCDRYGNRCLACGEQGPLTVDHVIPFHLGGPNTIANIQCLCLSCNDRKGTKVVDFRPRG